MTDSLIGRLFPRLTSADLIELAAFQMRSLRSAHSAKLELAGGFYRWLYFDNLLELFIFSSKSAAGAISKEL